jgi:hypothetical protein
MKNKDQILLESLYQLIYEAKVVKDNPQELIGKKVQVHPAIQGTPELDPSKPNNRYMAWSMKTLESENGKLKWKVVHNAITLLLKDCSAEVKHSDLAKVQLNPEYGGKQPNLLVEGTVVDVEFDMSKIPSILSSGDWKSITLNPHKHPEYVYKDKLPEWWNTDDRFPHDNPKIPDLVSNRLKASEERRKEGFEYNEVSKRISPDLSRFECDQILLKQYLRRGEDYMWVRGVK